MAINQFPNSASAGLNTDSIVSEIQQGYVTDALNAINSSFSGQQVSYQLCTSPFLYCSLECLEVLVLSQKMECFMKIIKILTGKMVEDNEYKTNAIIYQ